MQIRSLMTASDRVRDEQERLLRGGSPDVLQEAVARQREVVGALLESSKSVLASAGHPATEATLDRIRKTLLAVGGDDEGRRLLEAGRLTVDLDPAGFGALVPVASAGGGTTRPARKRPASKAARPAAGRAARERARRIEAAEAKLSALETEAAELKERVKTAKDEVRNAERTAQAARRAAEDEQRRLERLTARLEAARAGVERARSS
jgi:hypothetical protein